MRCDLTCFYSTLNIRGAVESDFGDYNCSVSNPHGQDYFIITLQKESKCECCAISLSVSVDIEDRGWGSGGMWNKVKDITICLQKLFSESLPLIIILSAVIGGIVLTVAVILIMILCRRTASGMVTVNSFLINGGAGICLFYICIL